MTTAQFAELGLPPIDRAWSSHDMSKAAKILQDVAEKKYGSLPRYRSPKSGDVFARLTSKQNLDRYKDHSVDVDDRLSEAINYLQSTNEIFKAYLSGFLKKEVPGGELIELIGMHLRTSVVMFDLVDEFLPTIKKDDPTYATRMQGFERMKGGLASIVAGSLKALTEQDNYTVSERVRLIGYMQDTFPELIPHLTPEARTQIVAQMETIAGDPSSTQLQPGLDQLRSKVKTLIEREEKARVDRTQ